MPFFTLCPAGALSACPLHCLPRRRYLLLAEAKLCRWRGDGGGGGGGLRERERFFIASDKVHNNVEKKSN